MESGEDTMEGLLQLPVDSVVELIGEFVKKNRQSEKIQTDSEEIQTPTSIIHFTHKHPLILQHDELEDDQGEKKHNDVRLCDGCITPISDPYYCCIGCNYFLHLNCGKLPMTLDKNPLHPQHTLVLKQVGDGEPSIKCKACKRPTTGLHYECSEKCDSYVDIKCASFPTSFAHASHPHKLILSDWKRGDGRCISCGRFSDIIFKCNRCKFYLDYECAQLPKEVQHKWDKHSLLLVYPPYDHPEDFICEICEKEMHPKQWMYYCSEHDQPFHVHCIPHVGKYSNINFGGKLKDGGLLHWNLVTLTRVRLGKYKSKCAVCHYRLDRVMAFESDVFDISFCMLCLKTRLVDCLEVLQLREEEKIRESSGQSL